MSVDTGTHAHDGTRYGALWTGVLLPPLAALTALEVGYVLAERACGTGQLLPLHLSFLGSLLACLAGGLIAAREWRRWGGRHASEEGGPSGRSRFLALMGLLSSGMFALAVAAQWAAVPFLHPCQ